MKTMPWTISDTDRTLRANTGNAAQWVCSVSGCTHRGTATDEKSAELPASRHSATHTNEELASTGYDVGGLKSFVAMVDSWVLSRH